MLIGEFLYAGIMVGLVVLLAIPVGIVLSVIDFVTERQKRREYAIARSEKNHEEADAYMEKFNDCYYEIIMKEIWED